MSQRILAKQVFISFAAYCFECALSLTPPCLGLACPNDEDEEGGMHVSMLQKASSSRYHGRISDQIVSSNKSIKLLVMTDMGFDDLGAIGLLHLAGKIPDAFCVVHGVGQPDRTAPYLEGLLHTWGLEQRPLVYESSFGPENCPRNLMPCYEPDWLADYRWSLYRAYEGASPYQRFNGGRPTFGARRDPWPGHECNYDLASNFKVFSIGSQIELANALLTRGNDLVRKISELVLVGGSFGNGSQLMRSNPVTWEDGIYGCFTQLQGRSHGCAEFNFNASAKATHAVLTSGLNITIIPIEVDGIDIFAAPLVPPDGNITRQRKTNAIFTDLLFKQLGTSLAQSFLHKLIGIKRAYPTNYTLDFDALASAYLWAPELFTFHGEKQLVAIDWNTGVTYGASPGLDCWNVTKINGPAVPCRCNVCRQHDDFGNLCDATREYTCGFANVASAVYSQGFFAKLGNFLRAEKQSL